MPSGRFRCGERRRQAHAARCGAALPEEVAVRLHAGLVRAAVHVALLAVVPEPAPHGAGRATVSATAGQKARLVLRAVRLVGMVRRRGHRRGEDSGMSVEDGLRAGGAVFAVLARRRPRSGGGGCTSHASHTSAKTKHVLVVLHRRQGTDVGSGRGRRYDRGIGVGGGGASRRDGIMLRAHLAAVGPSKVGRCRRHGGDVGVGPDEVEVLVLLDQGQALEVEIFGYLGHGRGIGGGGGMVIGFRGMERRVGSGSSTGRIKGGRYGQLGRERSKALQPRWGEGGSIDGSCCGIVGPGIVVGGGIVPDRTEPIGEDFNRLHRPVDGGRPRTGGPGGAGGHGVHLALDAGRVEYLRGGDDGRLGGIGSLRGGVAQSL